VSVDAGHHRTVQFAAAFNYLADVQVRVGGTGFLGGGVTAAAAATATATAAATVGAFNYLADVQVRVGGMGFGGGGREVCACVC
jgi:hypothetical protein